MAQSRETDDTTYVFIPFVSHEQAVHAAAGNAILGDRIWRDQNANGVQDIGEPSIAGVAVDLLNGCSGATVAATTLSNVNGDYLFPNLDAGPYRIQVTAPAGLSFTVKDAILDDDYDSDVDGSGISDCVTLGVDEENYRVDVGLNSGPPPTATETPTVPPTATPTPAPPTATPTPGGPTNTPTVPPPPTNTLPPTNTPPPSGNAILGDRVWNDVNVNGVQDIGEPGVSGVSIELLAGCTGTTVIATKTTNANGEFTFGNLGAAQYRLRITVPATFAITLQDAILDDDYDSDFEAIGVSSCVALGATEERCNLDAGITQGPVPTPTPTNTLHLCRPPRPRHPRLRRRQSGQPQHQPVPVPAFWGIASGMISM
ncbi:MAG: SdrD B-like domain-containing protein [Caldilineaceae bacterium]